MNNTSARQKRRLRLLAGGAYVAALAAASVIAPSVAHAATVCSSQTGNPGTTTNKPTGSDPGG